MGNPQLKTMAGWTWKRVLESLQAAKSVFVRSKPEVDKEKILSDREILGTDGLSGMGLRVVQEECFYVEPAVEKTA